MTIKSIEICDFCGTSKDQTETMIVGGEGKHICRACVRSCNALLKEVAAIEGGIENGSKVIPFQKMNGGNHAA